MSSILVTGSNGYIGSHVVDKLVKSGNDIVTIDTSEICHAGVKQHISADLFSDGFNLANYLDTPPDVCLHMAWRNGFDHNNLSHLEDLPGHVRFLQNIANSGVEHIAAMGSMHEVGYWEGSICESTPCHPMSYYGIAKLALRQALELIASKNSITWQWLRRYYIFGDDLRSQSIFGKIARAAKDGHRSFPFTTGKTLYDFLTVDELADQIVACISQSSVTGIIECCSGTPISLADKIEAYIRDNGFTIELDYGAFPERPYDSPGTWGDPAKLHSAMQQETR